MSFAVRRETDRVPIFSRVDIYGVRFICNAYALNLGGGGLSLIAPYKDVSDDATRAQLGGLLKLQLRLPSRTAPLEVRAKVAWIGQPTADPQGRRALPLGMRFEPDQNEAI